MTEAELFPLVALKRDEFIIFILKDAFNDRTNDLTERMIRERCTKYKYIIRVQRYLNKLYIIRVD